jgi:hypothetical protein
MFYDLSKQTDQVRFKKRSNDLFKKKCLVELTEKTVRTISQNSYLHLIISFFASTYGDKVDYCKREFYKKAANKELFEYEKLNKMTGEITKELRSSADLTKDEMTLSINRFRNWSAAHEIQLPSPEEREFLTEILIESEKDKEYL